MFVILIILISSPFLFYKLGNTSLTPWDEAWYGEIARNILRTGKLFTLSFNGGNFMDHPPAGFWIIALFEKIFGEDTFGVRIGSAFFALLTLIVVYYLGKKLFGRSVGFYSSIALLSAPWFLTRARSGNLDIFLTFFYSLCVYLAFLASENKKYLKYFFASIAILFLTKTMIPLTIIPSLFIIFWKKKITLTDFLKHSLIMIVPVSYWVYANYQLAPDQFIRNYLKIGLTGVGKATSLLDNVKLVKTYVHNGIGSWFRISVISMALGLIMRERIFFILTIIISSILTPFVFSEKGHIWHMIPAYPFMFITLFGFIYSYFNRYYKFPLIKNVSLFFVFLYFFIPQMTRNYREFINVPKYISDEEILSREAGKYSERLILDDDFIPTAVFYSNAERVSYTCSKGIFRRCKRVYSSKNVERTVTGLREYFDRDDKFLMIVREYKLGAENIKPEEYEIIKKDRDKLLIKKI